MTNLFKKISKNDVLRQHFAANCGMIMDSFKEYVKNLPNQAGWLKRMRSCGDVRDAPQSFGVF